MIYNLGMENYGNLRIHIKERIKSEILSGVRKPYEKIPSGKDYARELGISRLTLEYILEELAKEGYVFRIKGKGTFVSPQIPERSALIGFIAPDLKNPFIAEVFMGVEDSARKYGYDIVYVNSGESSERELLSLENLVKRDIKGIALYPSDDLVSKEDIFVKLLKKLKIPVVLIDRYFPNLLLDFVVSDNKNGGYQITRYLIEMGHKDIAFICSSNLSTTSVLGRYEGHKLALREAKIRFREDLVFNRLTSYKYFSFDKDVSTVREILKTRSFSAIFCANELIASVVYHAIKSENLRIPDDISVVGFGDTTIALYLDPPLTTIKQEKFVMGNYAIDILMRKIKGDSSITQIYLPTCLVIRNSVGRR